MARYIDADELRRRVKEKTNPYGKPALDYESGIKVLNMIDNAPTADVVPRAEIESLLDKLIEEAGKIADDYKKEANETGVLNYAKAEYRGTRIGALLVQYRISNLKKKYTEENK